MLHKCILLVVAVVMAMAQSRTSTPLPPRPHPTNFKNTPIPSHTTETPPTNTQNTPISSRTTEPPPTNPQNTHIPPHVTTTHVPITVPPLTPRGCFHEGKWYPPRQDISRGFDQSTNWCHGSYCDSNGNIITWDIFECRTTTTREPSSTSIPPVPSTEPTTLSNTFPPGCYHNGKWYLPGQEISRGYDGKNWCYGMICDGPGQIQQWDNFKCGPTTLPTTIPTTTSPPTRRRSRFCFYRGRRYPLNSNILESSNGNGWCFGRRCSSDGQVILWDDFNCQPSTFGGCLYGGHIYSTGSELFRIESQSTCYGGVCGTNGKVKTWTRKSCRNQYRFHGGRLKPSWCKYRGKLYPRGTVFAVKSLFKRHGFGWCRGAKCATNGQIVVWGPKWAPGYC